MKIISYLVKAKVPSIGDPELQGAINKTFSEILEYIENNLETNFKQFVDEDCA